jgi:alpha-beta hydrolase superfamily lysophospholipase
MRANYIFAALMIGLAACAPRLDLPGPAIADPVLKSDQLISADGREIALRRYVAADPRAIIIAAHGFNDYANAFHMAGPWFADRGITLIALDQRGFGNTPNRGRWAGTDALADDVATLVHTVHTQAPQTPIYLLGVSMGGAVSTVAASRYDLPIEGLILSGPAFWGWSQLNPVYRATLWTVAHVAPWYYLTGEGLRLWPSDNIEMLRALSRDKRMIRETRVDAIYGLVTLMDDAFEAAARVEHPTLVLFGEKDEIVPAAPVEAVVAQLPGPKRFVRYQNGWHMLLRDLKHETVYEDIEAWIADREAALPSLEEVALQPK